MMRVFLVPKYSIVCLSDFFGRSDSTIQQKANNAEARQAFLGRRFYIDTTVEKDQTGNLIKFLVEFGQNSFRAKIILEAVQK